jgi:hypothetical protein
LRRTSEACADNIDEALKTEGSFEVPISKITEFKPDMRMMRPYIRIRFQTDSGEKVFSFIYTTAMTQSGASPTAILAYKRLAKAMAKTKNKT